MYSLSREIGSGPKAVRFTQSRTRRDSASIPHCVMMISLKLYTPSCDPRRLPTKPPPKNMIVIETCSRSWAVHGPPHPPRCSRNILLAPYRNITKDSVNSAVGTLDFQPPTMARDGFTFHAHPKSEKQPSHRPRVKNPYHMKMPPLMKCASPLKIWRPRYTGRSLANPFQHHQIECKNSRKFQYKQPHQK